MCIHDVTQVQSLRVEMLASISVNHNLTRPGCKIDSSPVWGDMRDNDPARDVKWPWIKSGHYFSTVLTKCKKFPTMNALGVNTYSKFYITLLGKNETKHHH